MGQFLIVGLLFSAVCACLGRPQEPVAPAADPTTVDPAPAAVSPVAPAGTMCSFNGFPHFRYSCTARRFHENMFESVGSSSISPTELQNN